MHLRQQRDALLGLGRFLSGNIPARISAAGQQTGGTATPQPPAPGSPLAEVAENDSFALPHGLKII